MALPVDSQVRSPAEMRYDRVFMARVGPLTESCHHAHPASVDSHVLSRDRHRILPRIALAIAPPAPLSFQAPSPTVPDVADQRHSGTHNCRFWGGIADTIPEFIVLDHLLRLPFSLKYLSPTNPDGWSVAHAIHADSMPITRRGQSPAHIDSLFDMAVYKAAEASPAVAIAHVRNCSVGLCEIPNPHPFHRFKNGRHWWMAHNGTIDIGALLDLLRPEYMAENPPYYGQDSTDWIDSELYFLYILQTFQDSDWQVKPSLGHVVQMLRQAEPDSSPALNFALTDGNTLWSYREGRTLYYFHHGAWPVFSAVASRYPTINQEDWIMVAEGELLTMQRNQSPLVENIEIYFDLLALEEDSGSPVAFDLRILATPNPFNPSTNIAYVLPERSRVDLRVFDVAGRSVRVLVDGRIQEAGANVVRWDGTNDAGLALGSGVFFCRLRTQARHDIDRLVLSR